MDMKAMLHWWQLCFFFRFFVTTWLLPASAWPTHRCLKCQLVNSNKTRLVVSYAF